MKTILRCTVFTIAAFFQLASIPAQSPSRVQKDETIQAASDSVYQKLDALYQKNLDLVEKSQTNLDFASKVIDWSGMLFAALAILLIGAGAVGLKEFSNFNRVEAQMNAELERVRDEISQISHVRTEVQDELNRLKERIQRDGQNIFRTIYLLNDGITSFNSGNLQNAIKAFSEVKRINPDDYDATCLLARTYSGLEEFPKAIEIAMEAVSLSSSPRLAQYIIGECYRRMEKFDNAIEAFNESLKIEERASTLNSLGYCYFKMKDFAFAEKTFRRSLKLERYATGVIGLAKSLLKQESHERAREYCQEAIVLAKEDLERGVPHVWAYYNLAFAHLVLNNEVDCLKIIEVAIERNRNKGQIREQMFDYMLLREDEQIDQELLKKCIGKWKNEIESSPVLA
jgi:tetratricopeptide (TPR) repeat protein